jgi:hypothetical protein
MQSSAPLSPVSMTAESSVEAARQEANIRCPPPACHSKKRLLTIIVSTLHQVSRIKSSTPSAMFFRLHTRCSPLIPFQDVLWIQERRRKEKAWHRAMHDQVLRQAVAADRVKRAFRAVLAMVKAGRRSNALLGGLSTNDPAPEAPTSRSQRNSFTAKEPAQVRSSSIFKKSCMKASHGTCVKCWMVIQRSRRIMISLHRTLAASSCFRSSF